MDYANKTIVNSEKRIVSGITKELNQNSKLQPNLIRKKKLCFNSDHNKTKDFRFLFRYTMTKIRGPIIRIGIVLRP